ncbi:tRNA (adenosine(37)-N6)-threonylcarbamoyltransferase complex dimerization subunit type 1 TsaB [Planctomicrobium sp. SH668]|uniref:tRNA (adenosine(37)-N6)-threonylcarbamoyltransferase complex dimerization subunit type 1 TsaB n=1 Tax=Planctomicrobium sp. SH668 TaxID=3448126 RepID=UPI003F5C6710
MLTLAIETSGRSGSIALSVDGEIRHEIDLAANGRRHARSLVPEIAGALQSMDAKPSDVGLIAVSIGPGSFTSLRVGLVCAKTMAYAARTKLVGIDTFLAVAANQQEVDHVWVIEDALRGDVCAGEYRLDADGWRTVTPPRLLSLAEWNNQLPERSFITGPGLANYSEELSQFHLLHPDCWTPTARSIAILGEKRALAGNFDDPWTLEPFYMRRSAAEEKADAASATAS